MEIDGSQGEGGGQILRTALALAALTGEPLEVRRIRAGRRKPGLQPQHLTAVRAAAKICSARVEGDILDSQEIAFAPQSPPRPGTYVFDVQQAAKGGSAGATSLVLQAVLLPLALAGGPSQITLRGGTHVAWSPPYDYLKHVLLPMLARMGIRGTAQIERWGWYPLGGGEIKVSLAGEGALHGLEGMERGALLRVRGVSASSNLPKHIRTRQEAAALQLLRSQGVNARIDPIDAPSKGQGTAVFLWAESERASAGFTSLGALGKPAERVAGEAADELLGYLRGTAALDRHLADQLVLPATFASGRTEFTCQEITQHLLTVHWVVNQLFPGRVRVEGELGRPGRCQVQ
ncbi:MAG TPA: RNA 3'-terminal phosphate cyclase [Anaerolineae bacterium]|nr:RNA 3'-terminal phosphate cyclase [Anaerolineae bacterium]